MNNKQVPENFTSIVNAVFNAAREKENGVYKYSWIGNYLASDELDALISKNTPAQPSTPETKDKPATGSGGWVSEEAAEVFLYHLVDKVWNAVTESEEVPDPRWTQEIIGDARTSFNENKTLEILKACEISTASCQPTGTQDDWISVDDKMPETNVGVLVFIPDEDYHITSGMWDISQKWVLLDEYRVPECKVTHWRKMPAIPNEFHTEIEENRRIMNMLKEMKQLATLRQPTGTVYVRVAEKTDWVLGYYYRDAENKEMLMGECFLKPIQFMPEREGELYSKMYEWSKKVFPDATEIEHLMKLKHEAQEAIESPKDPEEYADCYLCLIASAAKAGLTYEQLMNAVHDKFSVVQSRKWNRLEDGTYQHQSTGEGINE